jgi:hypothetical protein
MSADEPNCGKRLIGYLTNVGEREMTDVQVTKITDRQDLMGNFFSPLYFRVHH